MPVAALGDQPSVSAAWLEAVRFLKVQRGRKCYNLAYVVTHPHVLTPEDRRVVAAFDVFARAANRATVTSVANTIFPLDCYLTGGAERVFTDYEQDVYPRVKKQWGNYVDRMTRRRDIKGNILFDKEGNVLNPLKLLVEKLGERISTSRGTTTHYELPIADDAFDIATYDPQKDYRYRVQGGPCLSHLSFKVEGSSVRLTAFYRSHFYLQRALGNLVGLARLQAFAAAEAGGSVGPLTIIASDASLERNMGSATTTDTTEFLTGLGI